MDCKKHNLKKDFIFCLEPDCEDRLVCKKCYLIDQQHFTHKRICIEYFMETDYDEFLKIFNETYAQTMKDSQNIKSFI